MSKTYLFITSILLDLFMQMFFNLSWQQQLFLICVFFCFFSILEYWGYFHFLEKKIKIFKIKKFLSLREAIDFVTESNFKTLSSTNDRLRLMLQKKDKTPVDTTLHTLLILIENKEVFLYGQKTITIKKSQALNVDYIDIRPFYYKENWSDDFSSVYDNNQLLYTNLQVKQTDLSKLVEKYKLPRRDIISS